VVEHRLAVSGEPVIAHLHRMLRVGARPGRIPLVGYIHPYPQLASRPDNRRYLTVAVNDVVKSRDLFRRGRRGRGKITVERAVAGKAVKRPPSALAFLFAVDDPVLSEYIVPAPPEPVIDRFENIDEQSIKKIIAPGLLIDVIAVGIQTRDRPMDLEIESLQQ